MPNNLQGFNVNCPVCHGSGNIPQSLPCGCVEYDPCPVCQQAQINQALYIGLLRILNYGIGQPNQQIIRQFNSDTIEIARRTLEECGVIPETFPNIIRSE